MYFSYVRKNIVVLLYICFIITALVLSLRLLFPLDTIGVLDIIILIMHTLIILLLGWQLFFGSFSFKFFIDSNGVKFKKRRKTFAIKWDEIKTISLVSYKPSSNIKKSMIYFESKNNDDSFSYYSASNYTKYNNKVFAVQYREEIMKEVNKYWEEPVQSIYQVESKSKQLQP